MRIFMISTRDAAPDTLMQLERFYSVVVFSDGGDFRLRNAGPLYAAALTGFQRIALIDSNALVLRNIDELSVLGAPALPPLGGDDLVRGSLGRDLLLLGLAVLRPSVALWARFLGDTDDVALAGSHADIWGILVGALATGEITCIPRKYRLSPAEFQELSDDDSALLDVAIVLGYRQATSVAAECWRRAYAEFIRSGFGLGDANGSS